MNENYDGHGLTAVTGTGTGASVGGGGGTPNGVGIGGGPVFRCDPRDAQLLALFRMSDDRGKELLLQIAGIHAARYPKGGQ